MSGPATRSAVAARGEAANAVEDVIAAAAKSGATQNSRRFMNLPLPGPFGQGITEAAAGKSASKRGFNGQRQDVK
jgi:hypothetical protein